ncbi:GxxExxY protein [Sedimentisphaera salicampi]
MTELEEAQIINYFKAAKIKLGLILNFDSSNLQSKRLIY